MQRKNKKTFIIIIL